MHAHTDSGFKPVKDMRFLVFLSLFVGFRQFSIALKLSMSQNNLNRGQVLGPWWTKKAVLNLGTSAAVKNRSAEELAQELRLSLLKLKGSFISDDGLRVDYTAIKSSGDFKEYKELCTCLSVINPADLEPKARKAFFINVYNALTVHAIVEGLFSPVWCSTTLGRLRLYAQAAYTIGGLPYSLNDIENGILRGNRKSAAPLTGLPFSEGDPRNSLCLECDPRIHFALNCGAKGCPPIAVYQSEELDEELDLAKEAFFVGGGMELPASEGGEVKMSMIFKWYEEDFDGDPLAWAAANGPTDNVKAAASAAIGVTYVKYNWNIND